MRPHGAGQSAGLVKRARQACSEVRVPARVALMLIDARVICARRALPHLPPPRKPPRCSAAAAAKTGTKTAKDAVTRNGTLPARPPKYKYRAVPVSRLHPRARDQFSLSNSLSLPASVPSSMPPTAMTLAMHAADHHHHHHPFLRDAAMATTPAKSVSASERPRGRSRTRRTTVTTSAATARDPWQILLAAAQDDDSDDDSDDGTPRLPAAFLALLSAKAAARRPRIDLTNAVTVAVAPQSSCDGCAAPLPVRPMHDVNTTRMFEGKTVEEKRDDE
ncbi:hypothetical protein GGF31_001049 [Allomyces arbusculus]|nr:hypothetical protein GGF31_001049 [Allomyces arbusculus]